MPSAIPLKVVIVAAALLAFVVCVIGNCCWARRDEFGEKGDDNEEVNLKAKAQQISSNLNATQSKFNKS